MKIFVCITRSGSQNHYYSWLSLQQSWDKITVSSEEQPYCPPRFARSMYEDQSERIFTVSKLENLEHKVFAHTYQPDLQYLSPSFLGPSGTYRILVITVRNESSQGRVITPPDVLHCFITSEMTFSISLSDMLKLLNFKKVN